MNVKNGFFKLWLKFIINKPKSRRGMWLTASITTRCVNSCQYCPLGKRHPIIPECSLEEWKDFIGNAPEWVSYICVSGGEPSLVDWFPDFVNWLLDTGRTVTIYSMLQRPDQFLKIKNSWRLAIDATYHHGDDFVRFTKAYHIIKDAGFNIEAYELDNEPKLLKYTKPKRFYTWKDITDTTLFHVAPDAPKTLDIKRGSEHLYGKSDKNNLPFSTDKPLRGKRFQIKDYKGEKNEKVQM